MFYSLNMPNLQHTRRKRTHIHAHTLEFSGREYSLYKRLTTNNTEHNFFVHCLNATSFMLKWMVLWVYIIKTLHSVRRLHKQFIRRAFGIIADFQAISMVFFTPQLNLTFERSLAPLPKNSNAKNFNFIFEFWFCSLFILILFFHSFYANVSDFVLLHISLLMLSITSLINNVRIINDPGNVLLWQTDTHTMRNSMRGLSTKKLTPTIFRFEFKFAGNFELNGIPGFEISNSSTQKLVFL